MLFPPVLPGDTTFFWTLSTVLFDCVDLPLFLLDILTFSYCPGDSTRSVHWVMIQDKPGRILRSFVLDHSWTPFNQRPSDSRNCCRTREGPLKPCQEIIFDHGGHQGASTRCDWRRRRGAQSPALCGGPLHRLPPRVVRQVLAERGADGGPQLPVEGNQQILIQDVPIDAHVVHELGHVGTLPGEDHLCGGGTSSQARTDSRARGLTCSREPKADPNAACLTLGRRRQRCPARTACPTPETPVGAQEGKAGARSS